MSEYQYYEFRAIDRLLTDRQMQELRPISTRAAISCTSFSNLWFAKIGAALLSVTIATSREVIAAIITMTGRLGVETGVRSARTSAALRRALAQPTKSRQAARRS